MRLALPLLLLATLAQATEVAFPFLSGTTPDGRTYVTSLAVENQKSALTNCSFRVRDTVKSSPFDAKGLRVYPDYFPSPNQATLVQAHCTSPVEASVRIQLSRDKGRTFDEGRLYQAVPVDPNRSYLIRTPPANIFFGETDGKQAEVAMICRSGSEVIGRKTWKLSGHDVRLIELDAEIVASSDLTVELIVVSGEGRIVVGQETDDADFAAVVPTIRGTSVAGVQSIRTPIERMLLVSSFKAAPFTDPATGLVFMRERWYDPKTGTFLGPDPMGYRDSPNPYTYGAGDPVNNTDPTGLALYAFDGTWNDRDQMKNDTNVAKLADAYRGGLAVYRKGVGTNWYSKAAGGLLGLGGRSRVMDMYDELQEIYDSGDRDIDVIGFSRGAAQALTFVNLIYQHGVYDSKRRARVIPNVRFLGLFDTVGSFGKPGNNVNLGHKFSIPPNVLRTRHALAGDEYRSSFPLTRVANPECGRNQRIEEKFFRGAHADIGGGYEDNDMLSRYPLQWMLEEMRTAGIRMADLNPAIASVPPGATVTLHQSHEGLMFLGDRGRLAIDRMMSRKSERRSYWAPCW